MPAVEMPGVAWVRRVAGGARSDLCATSDLDDVNGDLDEATGLLHCCEGPDRDVVEQLPFLLFSARLTVLYECYEMHQILSKDLTSYTNGIRCKAIVVDLCKRYDA
jgi:hypothetical protein